jgi:radical SAM superfamily enzyme YgiQ (UPF0313 family)
MKKLILINPVGRKSGWLLSRFSKYAPLGLAYIAAVTPAHWEVKIADENFVPFEVEEADLVGITAFTSNISRAYEIAKTYRERKIKVIMGGIHASMLPDEALQYADAVVVGEVEGIWEKVIEDFEKNRLSPIYEGPRIDLTQFNIVPRRDLLHQDYLWQSVQTSRGCPFNCDFCSVSRYLGLEYRQRTADDVLDELRTVKGKYITFLDDNMIGYSQDSKVRAIKIFEGMIREDIGKKWWMQTSINAAEDEKMIELAARAGCMFVFIGFESISTESLKSMRKGINLKVGVDNYYKVIRTFQKWGIGVYGGFIIGNDHESPQYYMELADFLIHSQIDLFQISILTPLPGTHLMEQLRTENRIIFQNFPEDWDKYRMSYLVHKPLGVTEDTVYTGNNYVKKRMYSFPYYPYRILRSPFLLKNLTNSYASYRLNKALKKSWQHAHYYRKYPMHFK